IPVNWAMLQHPKRRRRARTGRLVVAAVALLVLIVGAYASTYVIEYGEMFATPDPLLREDYSRLSPAFASQVTDIRKVEELQAVLKDARERKLKVSISGSRHSQGGHTYVAGGVVLNMRQFSRVPAIDTTGPTIIVQSGATWDEVQRAIAPHGLAIKVMQSSNIFTVGGTLSANAHGRDLAA